MLHMLLHVAHAVQHGHHQIVVRSVDTDVVVLAVIITETVYNLSNIHISYSIQFCVYVFIYKTNRIIMI